MMANKNGNILSSNANIICQQVNCQGVMGSGLAKEIRMNFPGCYEGYKQFCKGKNPHDLLGKVSWVQVNILNSNETYLFANVFGQLNYGRKPIRYTSYEALNLGLREVHQHAKAQKYSVALPYNMGCGLGGGDWIEVSKIINDVFCDEVVCEVWKL